MNNFGGVEVASARTTNAPGWAYVPDTGINPAVAALQPTNRKRARAGARSKLSLSDLSARQGAAVRKELEQLDRDNFKDVAVQVPARAGGPKGFFFFFPSFFLLASFFLLYRPPAYRHLRS
jgi:zinc finger HIT domain-containing protein 1